MPRPNTFPRTFPRALPDSRACSRRTVLGALTAALTAAATAALTGCTATGSASASAQSPPEPVAGAGNGPTDSGSAGDRLAAASSPSSASPSPSPRRTVTTPAGPVSVPESPSRVVVLGSAELDSALTLGLTPVGAARPELDTTLPRYFPRQWLESVTDVGPIGSPDLTAIARLHPDLILGNRTDDGNHYTRLTEIAPTVLTATTGVSWKQDFQVHAQALNRQSFADATTAAYSDHVRQFVNALGGSGSTRKQQIGLLRFVQDEDPRAYATQSFLGALLADAQLGRPAAQNVAAFDVPVAGTADLGAADGTVLFWSTYGDAAKAGTQDFTGSSAWQRLGAVKAHRAFQVADELWFVGIGYFAANLILAQLQRFLGE